MERLTQWFGYGSCREAGIASHLEEKHTAEKLVDILAARLIEYEDIGLEPEQIKQILNIIGAKSVGRLMVLVEADNEGRLVVLPCKMGQTVYFVLEDIPEFYPETNGWYISESEVSEVCTRGFSVDPIDGDEKILFYPYSDIGKTVFLTRKEAEAALAADINVGHKGGTE